MMNTIEEIETAIDHLSNKAQWDLIRRLHDRMWDTWDKEIEADAGAGRLDHLLSEVESDIAEGRVKSLNEIIDNP